MAQMAGLTSFTTNTVISSSEMNVNNTIITATYNAHDIASTAVHNVGAGAVVGTTLTQTLTNKTLTAPVINGTVTTTGLTLPEAGFAAAELPPTANKMVNESIIKAWCGIGSSYNVQSIGFSGEGDYLVTFRTPFASENYGIVAQAFVNNPVFIVIVDQSANNFSMRTYDYNGSVYTTQISFSFIAMGAQ